MHLQKNLTGVKNLIPVDDVHSIDCGLKSNDQILNEFYSCLGRMPEQCTLEHQIINKTHYNDYCEESILLKTDVNNWVSGSPLAQLKQTVVIRLF